MAGSVQGQAGWESRAFGGEGMTERWSLSEGVKVNTDTAKSAVADRRQKMQRSYTACGEGERNNLMSRVSLCVG